MPPRIALLLPDLISPQGAVGHAFRIAQAFRAEGRAVDLVVQRGGRAPPPVPEGIALVPLHIARGKEGSGQMAAYLREHPLELLLSFTHACNLLALGARRHARSRVPVFVGTGEPLSLFLEKRPEVLRRVVTQIRRWYPRADAIVACSAGVAEDLARTAGLDPALVRVIPNGFDLARIAAQAAEEPDHPWFAAPGAPIVLAVGRLIPQKGHATLLRAFARAREALRRDGRDARLVILGEGPRRDALARLVGELALDDAVRLPGTFSNPFALLRRAALLVHPSRWEGFGNVLVEALACGTPVVAADCPGGPREILAAGRFGTLVPVDDPEALAAAILAALDAMPDRAALRRRAAEFDHAVIARRYLELLASVPSPRSAP